MSTETTATRPAGLTPRCERFKGYYRSANPQQHVNWRLDTARRTEGGAFVEMHIDRTHVGSNRTSKMQATAQFSAADARRLARTLCPEAFEALDLWNEFMRNNYTRDDMPRLWDAMVAARGDAA